MAATACHRRASLNPPGWAGSRQTEIGCGRVTWACVAMECVSHFLLSLSPRRRVSPLSHQGPLFS